MKKGLVNQNTTIQKYRKIILNSAERLREGGAVSSCNICANKVNKFNKSEYAVNSIT